MNEVELLDSYLETLDGSLFLDNGSCTQTGKSALRLLDKACACRSLPRQLLQLKFDLEIACHDFETATKTLDDLQAYEAENNLERLLLRILTYGDLKAANTVYDHFSTEQFAEFLTQERALEFLKASLRNPQFRSLGSAEIANLFYVNALTIKNNSFLKDVSDVFTETMLEELVGFASAFVNAQGGQLHYVTQDTLFDVENKSALELKILEKRLWNAATDRMSWLRSIPEHIQEIYSTLPEFSEDYIKNIFSGPGNSVLATRVVMNDHETPFVKVVGNLRSTLPDVTCFKNRILLCGASDIYGFGCEDRHTVASFLQDLLTSEDGTCSYRVENHGVRGNPFLVCLNNLMQTAISPGDVVVLFGPHRLDLTQSPLPAERILHLDFSRPHDRGEIFIDHNHVGRTGSEWIAQRLNAHLFRPKHDETTSTPVNESEAGFASTAAELIKYLIYRRFATTSEAQGLDKYLDYLDEYTPQVSGKKVGSIAVNCNPITNGHLHLIEYGASQVDTLFLFVIQEDQSFFSFVDRFDMVKSATEKLGNVVVVKGGRYICTEFTYPEYFTKDNVQNLAADASMEAWYFCEFIAPRLRISKIFLGDEPNCKITKQYNEKFSELLPQFEIEVDIIPRISHGDSIISASTVRKLLKSRRFDEMAELVPPTTLSTLMRYV